MSQEILDRGKALYEEVDRLQKFSSKYNVYPYDSAKKLCAAVREFCSIIPDTEDPKNMDDLLHSELKRRMNGIAFRFESWMDPKPYDYQTVISLFGIPDEDLVSVKDRLLASRQQTLDAVERLFQTREVESYELSVQFDVPRTRNQIEEVCDLYVDKYHRILGKMLQARTKVGEFLRDIRAVPSSGTRSYFHPLTNTLAVSIPSISTQSEDGILGIKENELISLYGHEGMGHALNQVLTLAGNMPYFLKKCDASTAAVQESVAQFYEKVIFDDLQGSPKTLKDLGLEHTFEQIYQFAKDTAQLTEYKRRLFEYAIMVNADKSLGDPQDSETMRKKADLIRVVALDPRYPEWIVEDFRKKFDSHGNLDNTIVDELRYAAQPVRRALEEFSRAGMEYSSAGRDLIDATFLNGFWTPTGFVDNAKIAAQQAKR